MGFGGKRIVRNFFEYIKLFKALRLFEKVIQDLYA